jgi:hypothetical protein
VTGQYHALAALPLGKNSFTHCHVKKTVKDVKNKDAREEAEKYSEKEMQRRK